MLRRGLTGPISRRRRFAAIVHRLAGALGARKVDIVGHHGNGCTVVAVLVLIIVGLETAIDGDQTALLEIAAHKLSLLPPRNNINEFGGLAPCHDIHKISLTLLAGLCKVAVTGNAEAADIRPRRGGTELRIRHKAAHNCDNIKH